MKINTVSAAKMHKLGRKYTPAYAELFKAVLDLKPAYNDQEGDVLEVEDSPDVLKKVYAAIHGSFGPKAFDKNHFWVRIATSKDTLYIQKFREEPPPSRRRSTQVGGNGN